MKNRKVKRAIIIVSIILGIVAVSACAAAGYLYFSLNKLSTPETAQVKPEDNIEPVKVEKGEPTNILIMGADYAPGESTDFSHRLTDTMMVAHYDPDNDKLQVVSVPRDTMVSYNDKNYKLNAINVIGGPKLLTETIEGLLGIKINYYILIDYNGFSKLVDNLGGVTLTVPHTMKYDDSKQDLHIDFQKGETITLDGKKAEEFFRWRKNNEGVPIDTIDKGGDIGRIDNQRVFIKALIEKVSKPSTLTKVPSLINTAVSYVKTNMPPSDILKYGSAFAKLGNSNINFATAKGEAKYVDEISYYVFDKDKNGDIMAALNGTPNFIDKEKLSVKIIDESGKSSYAKELRTYLTTKSAYSLEKVETAKSEIVSPNSSVEVFGIDPIYDEILLKDLSNFGISKITHSSVPKTDFDLIIHIGQDAVIK